MPAPVDDGDETPDDLPVEELPASHRSVVAGTDAQVGLLTDDGPIALPASWLGEAAFAVSSAALAVAGARDEWPAVALFDESASRRPDEKLGVMFRGTGTVRGRDDDRAVLTIDTERVTTWDGFSADTTSV